VTTEELDILKEILAELKEINSKLDTIKDDVANIFMK
jgi:hypothetical protein